MKIKRADNGFIVKCKASSNFGETDTKRIFTDFEDLVVFIGEHFQIEPNKQREAIRAMLKNQTELLKDRHSISSDQEP